MKMMAVCLAVCVAWFQIAMVEVKATSMDHEYKTAHGVDNDSEDLYLWHRCKIDDNDMDDKPLTDFLSDKSTKQTFRILLTYRENGDGQPYYIEANWTKAIFTKNTSDVAGTVLQAVSTKDNQQVRVGDDTFITRGALRSFVAKITGFKDFGVFDAYRDTYQYALYAPNEADDGMDVIGKDGVRLGITYDDTSEQVGLWFYDSDGNPCGNSSSASAWNNAAYKRSHFKNNGDNWFYEDWCLAVTAGWAEKYTYQLVCEDTSGYNPKLCHSEKGGIYQGKAQNMMTVNKNSGSDVSSDNLWIVYVGEKIGTITHIDKGNSYISINGSYIVNSPAYIKEDQRISVEPGAVMFVNSILEIDGSIDNRGTIIVGDNALITGNAAGTNVNSAFYNGGGDLIIYKNGTVSMTRYTSEDGGQLILLGACKDNLLTRSNIYLESGSVVDYSGSAGNGTNAGVKSCNGRTIRGFSGVQKKDGKFIFNRGSAKIESSGLKTKFEEQPGVIYD